jgi:4-hydroxysphinganine ceramide fatty acyl 2-hydroxylase
MLPREARIAGGGRDPGALPQVEKRFAHFLLLCILTGHFTRSHARVQYMKLYVSNKKETPRMFQSDFVEFFSRVHWTVPLVIYVPVSAFFVYLAAARYELRLAPITGLFLLGAVLWSATEYIMHRFVFHYHPKTEWGRRFHWTFHGVHHDYPSDPLRLVMVPSVSLPLGALFYFIFSLVFGMRLAAPIMSGFAAGYLFYDITHYAVHHFPLKGKVFGYLRTYHMRHHFEDADLGYGVSSPFWDLVFNTAFTRK